MDSLRFLHFNCSHRRGCQQECLVQSLRILSPADCGHREHRPCPLCGDPAVQVRSKKTPRIHFLSDEMQQNMFLSL